MPKRGLPDTLRMRHDAHYVETLAASAGAPVGRLVPIDQVDPNPDQPRQAMGDLAELVSSVTEKGIIEPLIVRQRGPRYQIIAGERRYHAAVQAGLHELPVVDACLRLVMSRDRRVFEALIHVMPPQTLTRVARQGPVAHTGRVPPDRQGGGRRPALRRSRC